MMTLFFFGHLIFGNLSQNLKRIVIFFIFSLTKNSSLFQRKKKEIICPLLNRLKKNLARSGNRTRVTGMGILYSTTKPSVLSALSLKLTSNKKVPISKLCFQFIINTKPFQTSPPLLFDT